MAGKRVRVAGWWPSGTSFGADGNLLTSSETYLSLLPETPPGSIEVGLIRLRAGSRSRCWCSVAWKRPLPHDVASTPKQGFIDFEMNYWRDSTSIGFIFTLGAAMGFVVGCVIVYQILYSDVSDHLPEYATLMAMGYRLSPCWAWWRVKGSSGAPRLRACLCCRPGLYVLVRSRHQAAGGHGILGRSLCLRHDPGDVHGLGGPGDAPAGRCRSG